MTDFFEQSGLNLLSNCSDPDGDPISLDVVGLTTGTAAIPTYPATYALDVGSITITSANGDFFVPISDNNSNPADGVTVANGTLVFKVVDSKGAVSPAFATATINLTGQAGGTAPTPITAGLLAHWKPDAGVALSGSDVTSWTDQISGRVVTAVGTPAMTTSPNGEDMIAIGDLDGFEGADASGLPSGTASRSIQMFWKPLVPFFGGASYGANVADQAFTNGVDDAGEISADYRNSRLLSGVRPLGEFCSSTVTYDGTTVRIYVGDVLVASETKALATVASLVKICRTYSGYTTQAEVGDILIYGRALTLADVAVTNNYFRFKFIGSASVPDPAFSAAGAVAQTSFTANVTVGSPYAVVAWSARTSSTDATEAEILAGTGAISYGLAITNGAGVVALPVTGGTASTAYYVNAIVYGIVAGKSAVVRSSSVTTTAAPVANPVLSSATLTSTGQTSLSGSVTTDVGNGTLEYGLMLQSALTPTITQIEAGTDGGGAPLIGGLRTQPVTATGAQGVIFTGLVEGTPYKAVYAQRDGSANASNVVTANATTDSATATPTSYTADSTATTQAGLQAILAAWAANPSGTAPAGKTATDTRVVQLTAPIASLTLSSYDFTAITGGVVVRGIGPYDYLSAYPFYPTCGSDVSGTITVSNCQNLTIYGITARKIVFSNSPRCFSLKSSAHSRWSTTRSRPSVTGPGIQFLNSPAGGMGKSHVGGFNTLSVDVGSGCDDIAIEDNNYLEQFSDDLVKYRIGSTTVARGITRRNWAGRDNLSPVGAHSDFQQNQTGNTPDFTFWGNTYLAGAMLNNISLHSFIWQSNSNTADNTVCEQNLYFGRGTETYDAAAGSSAAVCRYNTAIYCEVGDHGSVQPAGMGAPKTLGGWNTLEYNFVTRLNSGSADTSGTGGVVFTIGDVFGSSIVANTSGYPTYWDGFPSETTYIDKCKPLVGSPAHWDYSGQKIGGWDRAREIWVDGNHPGNDGWPTAGRFHAEYDPSNTLGSGYNGTFDADGNNLVAAPTSVTINNALTPIYGSDPYGLDVARITFSGTHNKDGSGLRIKVIDTSDSSDVVAWQSFTAGSGGAWSVAVDVPRGFRDLRAVVDAVGNAAVTASQATTFRVGYIVAIVGQSEALRPFTTSQSSADLTPPAKTMWVKDNSVSGIGGGASSPPVEVGSGSTLGLRRMAVTVGAYSDAPVMFVMNSEVGTGLAVTVNSNETTDRSWFGTVEDPVTYLRAQGTDVDLLAWHWPGAVDGSVQTNFERWAAPAMVGQSYNGLVATGDGSGLQTYTTGSVSVVPARAYTPARFFFDMSGLGRGLYDTARTKFTVLHGASFINPQGANGVYASNDQQKGIFSNAQRATMDGVPFSQISLAGVPGWTGQTAFGGHMAAPEGTHVSDDVGDVDGEPLAGVSLATGSLRALGALLAKEPKITQLTTNAGYWDVEVDLPHGGDLSTAYAEYTAGNYAGSFEATNWQAPTLIDEGDAATVHAVAGFAVWTGGTADWQAFTAVIQDAGTGTVPTRRGVIRVTPNGGSTAGKTLSFGLYDGFNMISVADAKAARIYAKMPIETRVHVSGTGYGWPVVRQQGSNPIAIW